MYKFHLLQDYELDYEINHKISCFLNKEKNEIYTITHLKVQLPTLKSNKLHLIFPIEYAKENQNFQVSKMTFPNLLKSKW